MLAIFEQPRTPAAAEPRPKRPVSPIERLLSPHTDAAWVARVLDSATADKLIRDRRRLYFRLLRDLRREGAEHRRAQLAARVPIEDVLRFEWQTQQLLAQLWLLGWASACGLRSAITHADPLYARLVRLLHPPAPVVPIRP